MSTQHTRYVQASPPVAALVDFRAGFFRCLTGWADAAFELCDAALCAPAPAGSVPALSLEPTFRRSHGSLYKALSLGRIDHEQMRDLLVAHRPTTWPAVFAVDASTWARCDAETSPERGFYYSASKHWAGQPIVAGWSYQWITQLDWAFDSWTAPVDAARIPPTADATTFTIEQVTRLAQRLPDDGQVPMFVFDAGYDPIAIGAALTDTAAQVLVRIRGDRVFYTDPHHPAAAAIGRPRRHGTRFALSDPESAPVPTAELSVQDKRHGRVHVSSWTGLHPKLGCRGHWANHDHPPIVAGTVIRVDVEHLPRARRELHRRSRAGNVAPGQGCEGHRLRCRRARLIRSRSTQLPSGPVRTRGPRLAKILSTTDQASARRTHLGMESESR
jgi:hypothetical protein